MICELSIYLGLNPVDLGFTIKPSALNSIHFSIYLRSVLLSAHFLVGTELVDMIFILMNLISLKSVDLNHHTMNCILIIMKNTMVFFNQKV
jgi:hypothetical protein